MTAQTTLPGSAPEQPQPGLSAATIIKPRPLSASAPAFLGTGGSGLASHTLMTTVPPSELSQILTVAGIPANPCSRAFVTNSETTSSAASALSADRPPSRGTSRAGGGGPGPGGLVAT